MKFERNKHLSHRHKKNKDQNTIFAKKAAQIFPSDQNIRSSSQMNCKDKKFNVINSWNFFVNMHECTLLKLTVKGMTFFFVLI